MLPKIECISGSCVNCTSKNKYLEKNLFLKYEYVQILFKNVFSNIIE